MRPSKTVASALLSAVLAVASLPGLAGSRTLSPEQAIDAAAFQSVLVGSWQGRSTAPGGPLDPALESAGALSPDSRFQEPGQAGTVPTRAKPAVYFGGKFRIIDFALSNCVNSGIRRIGVVTQYKSHSLLRHLQRGWSFLRAELNEMVDLMPAQQRVDEEHW